MPKQILLYYPVYSYTVADVMTQMDDAKDEDIDMRINSGGGEVLTSYGVIAKFQEHTKGKRIKVDGIAASICAFLLCYVPKEQVECLDVSEFVFHRAAYPEWMEQDSRYFTDDMRATLVKTNGDLRAAMEARIDVAKFEKIAKVTLDEMFSLDSRIDVRLDAKQAKQIGLVGKINTITPAKQAEIATATMQMAAHYIGIPKPEATIEPEENKKEDMPQLTLAEILAQYPNEVKSIQDASVKAERERVAAFVAVIKIAPEAALKGIADGSEMTMAQVTEFAIQAAAGAKVDEVVGDNNKPLATTDVDDKNQNSAEVTAFLKEVEEKAGIKGFANTKLTATK